MIKTLGVSHVTLTVKNIEQECKFYSVLFETSLEVKKNKVEEGVVGLSLRSVDIPISFRQVPRTPKDDTFDYLRIGLDHIAIQVPDESELGVALPKIIEAWRAVDASVLDGKTKGIEICEHTGRKYICFHDPSGIPVEFYIGH